MDEGRTEEEAGEDSAEGQWPKPAPQPDQPTKAQIQGHELTHSPFRSWCVHCVKGKGRTAQTTCRGVRRRGDHVGEENEDGAKNKETRFVCSRTW